MRGFYLESGLIPFESGATEAGFGGRVPSDPLSMHLSRYVQVANKHVQDASFSSP